MTPSQPCPLLPCKVLYYFESPDTSASQASVLNYLLSPTDATSQCHGDVPVAASLCRCPGRLPWDGSAAAAQRWQDSSPQRPAPEHSAWATVRPFARREGLARPLGMLGAQGADAQAGSIGALVLVLLGSGVGVGIRGERDGGSRVATKEPRAWSCSRSEGAPSHRSGLGAAPPASTASGAGSPPFLGVLPGTPLWDGGWGRFPPASP